MCTEGERNARRVLAKTLLLHTLRIGEGPAAEMADNFTDEQLDAICAINATHPRFRRQEIKALLSQITDASRVTASLPATPPDPDPPAEPEPETAPEPPRKPKRPKPN